MKKFNARLNIKKYRVSLAVKVPCNFEVEVNAVSEKDALKKALREWDGDYDEHRITEPDWANLELDINETKPYDLGSGIYIEERG